MATITTALAVTENDGREDNKQITPNGGAIFLQLSRGFSCIINGYRADILQPNGVGGWHPATDPAFAEGRIPSLGHATEVFFRLGSVQELSGRRVLLLAEGTALPPNSLGQVDSIVGIYQQNPQNQEEYRRVEWEADSGHNVNQLMSRFQITIT